MLADATDIALENGDAALVINTPTGTDARADGDEIRGAAVAKLTVQAAARERRRRPRRKLAGRAGGNRARGERDGHASPADRSLPRRRAASSRL